MRTILERRGQIGEPSVKVWEHGDAPGEFVVDITRGGLPEDSFTAKELRQLAADLTEAAQRVEGVKQ